MKQAAMPYHTIADADAYKKLVRDNSAKHFLVSAALEGSALTKFKKANFRIREFMPNSIGFAHSGDAATFGIESMSKGDIYLQRWEADGTRSNVKYDRDSDGTLSRFIRLSPLPVFQEFTQENAVHSIPLLDSFFENSDGQQCKAIEAVARKGCNSKVAFAWVSSVELICLQNMSVSATPRSNLRIFVPDGCAIHASKRLQLFGGRPGGVGGRFNRR